MSKLKQQFSELRQNTPKRVQWLLLVVAFVLVIILLTLLLGGGNKQEDISKTDQAPTEIKISPDMVNWADVLVGDKKTQTIKVWATAPAKVFDVRLHKEIAGLKISSACPKMGQINANLACKVEITYAPTSVMAVETIPVFIDWHDADETDAMKKTEKIVLTLGAVAPKVEVKPIEAPKPIVLPEPEPEIEIEPEPVIVKQEIKREIEAIAPPVKFDTPKITQAVVEDAGTYEIPDGCSDFAFPGYGNSGRQIGWIKPSGGAYKFHPFSDKDCTKPTGTYNPDNGIITDDKGKKIGTDADHIGFSVISGGELPELSNAPAIKKVNRAQQLDDVSDVVSNGAIRMGDEKGGFASVIRPAPVKDVLYATTGQDTVTSTAPYDRSFVLRQYKPIPATIVSDVRADIEALELGVPVRATVDRNVYSDNGRTVVIPTGTLLLGYVTGEVPGPYKAIGRMNIKWYQFIRPDGVEFNFSGGNKDPYSGDAQGRVGVPGRGSTDYMEQFLMPMLTAFVPAAVNLINPVADAFVNQIDLDNNTVVQSGTMRSSELAKNEIITAWNQVAQKLMVDMMDNTVPPFTIAAGTRITVYSPVDLQITCGDPDDPNNIGKKCAVAAFGNDERRDITESDMDLYPAQDDSWVGQSRSFAVGTYCEQGDEGLWRVKSECSGAKQGELNKCGGHSYSTLKMYCDSLNYQSKKALQYDVYREDQQKQYQQKVQDLGGVGSQQYNEEILGIKYNPDGTVQNPYAATSEPVEEAPAVLTCEDGNPPDANGCCAGEIYTDMGEQGFNCCPEAGGDCFPPIL